MRRSNWWSAPFVLLGLVACGTPASNPPEAAVDMAVAPDLTDVYPPAPYGANEGEVAPNFELQGYFSTETTGLATSKPFGAVTFDQLRRSGARYLFLASGAFW